MKKLLVLAAMIYGTNLYSCPNLAGTWTCDSDGDPYDFDMIQTVDANGDTVYDDGDQAITANGEWQRSDDGSEIKMVCLNSKTLKINQISGNITAEGTSTLKNAVTLIMKMIITLEDGEELEYLQQCNRS